MKKFKKIEALERMEKRIKRRLIQGHTTEVISDIKFIIAQYRDLKLIEKADLLEMILNQFISETSQGSKEEFSSLSEPRHHGEPTLLNETEQSKESMQAEEPKPPKKTYSKKDKRDALQFLHKD
ncbi:MAG: hypothetical protein ACFFD2_03930 [Promethearchaeota archaeon]